MRWLVAEDQFATEGLGEDGLGEIVDVSFGFGVAGLDLVGQREQAFHSANDFLLLGQWSPRLRPYLSRRDTRK